MVQGDMAQILVTGANGFVGRHLCTRLFQEGHTVRGAVRRRETLGEVPPGAEAVVIERMMEEESWQAPLEGIAVVVHLIARTHVLDDRAADPLLAYRQLNVDLTRTIVQASLSAGVERFVFLSSIKAVGEGSDEAYTETTLPAPEDAYGVSKLEAERLLFSLTDGSTLAPVVLRPPLVYGPGVKGNVPRLLQAVSRGLPLPFGNVRNARSMVSVGNLADAVALCAVYPAARHETFHVADDEAVSTRELVQLMGEGLGKAPRLVPFPPRGLTLGGRLLGRREEVMRLIGNLTVSSRKLKEQLGWTPPQTARQAWLETGAWFRSR